jgi:hypothetical protein
MKTKINKLFILVILLNFIQLTNAQQRVVTITGITPGQPLVYDQIYTAIVADAPNRVTNKNVVYELKRGQVYLATSTINSTDYDLYLRAEAGTGQPPLIFHTLNSAGQSSPIITARKNLTLENLEFDGKHSDGSFGNRVLNMYGLNGRVIIKGCRLINDRGGAFAIQVDGVKLYMTDCIVGNQGHHISVGGNGRVIDVRNTGTVDTLIVQNTTIYNLSDRVIRNMGPVINYLKFDHNTVVNVQGYHGCIQLGKTKKAVVTNNIFYNPLTYGDRFPTRWRAEQTQPDKAFAVITHDSLSTKLTAATVEMRNNNIFFDQNFYDFYNQTPPGDSIGDVRPINNAIIKFLGAALPQAYFKEPLVLKNTSSGQMLYEFEIYWVTHPKASVFPNNFSVIYPYEWDVSYPVNSRSYTAGDNGFPVGNLNAFPAKRSEWGKSAVINSGSNTSSTTAEGLAISECFPNPFKSQTTIFYSVTAAQKIEVSIYNMTGQKTTTLVNRKMDEGNYSIVWDGKNNAGGNLPRGSYFLTLSGEKGTVVRKILKN